MSEKIIRRLLAVGMVVILLQAAIPTAETNLSLHTQNQNKENVEGIALNNDGMLYVGGSGPNNYSKIQDAIDDASSGDTIFVYDDSSPYYENVVIDKSIDMVGENKETTIIDGNEKGNVVEIIADEAYINGFTMQNSGMGVGVRLSSVSNTAVIGNIIIHNGGGILIDHSDSNTISHNVISNNEDKGIYLFHHSDSNSIHDNTIGNNRCGIYLDWSDSNAIIGNTITDNGYGISLLSSTGNNINYNNFMNSEFFHASFQEGIYLCFNNWNRNYWDNWRLPIPKPILGGIWVYGGVPIPLLNFDWLPLLIPYEGE